MERVAVVVSTFLWVLSFVSHNNKMYLLQEETVGVVVAIRHVVQERLHVLVLGPRDVAREGIVAIQKKDCDADGLIAIAGVAVHDQASPLLQYHSYISSRSPRGRFKVRLNHHLQKWAIRMLYSNHHFQMVAQSSSCLYRNL